MHYSVLLCVGLSLFGATAPKSVHVDYLLIAQFWPPTSCYVFFGKDCDGIPSAVKGWTLHGLWPSVHGQDQPFYCNKSYPFDYSEIESLKDQLAVQWVNYDSVSGPQALWSHEWEKHGTCAASIPALKGMYNYFNRTLHIHKALNVLGALEKRGVVPHATKPYYAQDFYNALLAQYGVKPSIVCQTKKGKFYIEQLYICLSTSFKLQNCSEAMSGLRGDPTYNDCPQQGKTPVIFLPLNNTYEPQEKRIMYFKSEVEEVITWEEN